MPWRIWVLWGLFLARGSFYCFQLPLWEGWDEYAHFAFLQHAVFTFALPRADELISREIDESMRLAPLADELRWIGAPYLTHPQWWALPEAERTERVVRLNAMPPSLANQKAEHQFAFYEAQQPPLYYWLLSLPLSLMGSWHLWARVLAMRLLSMGLASFAIPLTFLTAQKIMADSRALLCAALLASAPGLAIDASRVANDSLAIALVALLCWLVMRRSRWLVIGFTLGATLITKAYCLGLIPALILLGMGRAALPALLTGGWWYARNLLLGLSATGWQDTSSASGAAQAVLQVNWIRAAQVGAKTFLWYGAWSFLSLKSWIYTVLNGAGLIAAFEALRNHRRELAVPLVFTACFIVELAYGVLNIQATHNIGTQAGWYLWPVGGAMAMIMTAGLGRATWLLILAMAAIEIYGATLMARHYHTGLTWLCLVPLVLAELYCASGGLAEALPSINRSNQ